MSSAKVSARSPTSMQRRSERTAGPSQPPDASNGETDKSMIDKLHESAENFYLKIQALIISIQNFFYSLYLVLKFIWEKPDIAWDLVSTTFHLIKVSRDAGLWSWTQLWDIFYAQTVAPMIRAEKAKEEAAAKKAQ